jgi:hypothetical protein
MSRLCGRLIRAERPPIHAKTIEPSPHDRKATTLHVQSQRQVRGAAMPAAVGGGRHRRTEASANSQLKLEATCGSERPGGVNDIIAADAVLLAGLSGVRMAGSWRA